MTITPPALMTIEMTDGYTNLTHHVTDEAMAQGRRAGGCYRALCGARVEQSDPLGVREFRCG
ncbi:MAG: hypothetical protein ACRDRB_02730 [Pseudonocardiaceae bacterium]